MRLERWAARWAEREIEVCVAHPCAVPVESDNEFSPGVDTTGEIGE